MFHPLWHLAAMVAMVTSLGLAFQMARLQSSHRVMMRNFYGGLRVLERDSGGGGPVRVLVHGIINHGSQFLDPIRRREPTSYYAPYSGAALAITRPARPPRQKVGIVGLGTGTLAALGRAGDEYRFYEINPQIVDLARTQFTYLADSPATVSVVLGDGRLSLEREPDQHFDVLCIDAFSGDSIPTHLLTREAFTLYRRHLAPDGLLALHITNRYLDLAPVAAQGAASLRLDALHVQALPNEARFWSGSNWVLIGLHPEAVTFDKSYNFSEVLLADPARRPWTDDENDLWGVLKR